MCQGKIEEAKSHLCQAYAWIYPYETLEFAIMQNIRDITRSHYEPDA